jgi:predicted GTPase
MRKVIIMGAGGRDFHNFNTVFRADPETQVVAFTATQIPGIAHRFSQVRSTRTAFRSARKRSSPRSCMSTASTR